MTVTSALHSGGHRHGGRRLALRASDAQAPPQTQERRPAPSPAPPSQIKRRQRTRHRRGRSSGRRHDHRPAPDRDRASRWCGWRCRPFPGPRQDRRASRAAAPSPRGSPSIRRELAASACKLGPLHLGHAIEAQGVRTDRHGLARSHHIQRFAAPQRGAGNAHQGDAKPGMRQRGGKGAGARAFALDEYREWLAPISQPATAKAPAPVKVRGLAMASTATPRHAASPSAG